MSFDGTPEIKGPDGRLYVGTETTFKTAAALVGADYVPFLEFSCSPSQKREDRDDSRITRGIVARDTVGVLKVEWSLKSYLYPATTAGSMSAHGFHDLLLAAFGKVVTVGGVSDKYTPDSSQTALKSVTMLRSFADGLVGTTGGTGKVHFSEWLLGTWVNSLKLSVQGANKVMVEFAGGAAIHAQAARGLANGAGVGATALVLRTAGAQRAAIKGFDAKCRVMLKESALIANGDPSLGYLLTAVNDGTNTVTISPAATWSDGDEVMPWSPKSAADAGPTTNPLVGVSGSLVWDTDTVPILGVEFEINQDLQPEEEQAFTAEVPDVFVGTRKASGQVTTRSRRDLVKWLGERKRFTATDLGVTFGETPAPARHAILDVDRCELEFAAPSFPSNEKGTLTLPFRGLNSTGSADDDCALTMK